MTINGVRFIGMDMRARVITLNGDCVEMTSQDIDTEILLNYSAILHPHLFESENPSTCVLPRMCVGVPRRLLALAASVQKGEIPSESSKELKDSRNFKDSMVIVGKFLLLTSLVARFGAICSWKERWCRQTC